MRALNFGADKLNWYYSMTENEPFLPRRGHIQSAAYVVCDVQRDDEGGLLEPVEK